jgi:RNA polymerase sigma-70 factor, ECF subfamily
MFKRLQRDTRALDASSPPPEAEVAVLERIRAGDEQAFEHLFRSYYQPLCDFVSGYVRSPETAEELVQAVFLRLWQNRETWRPAVGIRAYLFAACRNQSLDHLKHQRVAERGSLPGQADASIGAPPVRPDEAAHASELTEAIRRAVQQLPERRRAVVVLRWEHQLTNLEIARALGISIKAVEAHVTRALVFLRQRLGAFKP